MVKRRTRGVLIGIDEKEFSCVRAYLPIPEAIILGDPVWGHFGNIDAVTQISGKKLLGALIVLAGALSRAAVGRKEQQNSNVETAPRASVHGDSSSKCFQAVLFCLAAFVVFVFCLCGAHEGDGRDSFIEQRAVERRNLLFNEVLIAALRLGKVFFNSLQDGRSGISGRAIHTSSHISRTRTDFAVQPDQLEIGLFWNGIIFVVTQSVGARNESVLDVLHLLVHGFDSLQQFGVGIGFALLLFRPLCCVVG